jgi:hypothetical protein
LAGITPLTYDPDRISNPNSALGSACDSIRRELNDASLLFPREGAFGANILHPDLVSLEADKDFSMTALIPYGRSARVVVATSANSEVVPWSMPIGPAHGFNAKRHEGNRQEFSSVGDGLVHTPIAFDGAGRAKIEVYLGDERVLTKEIEWT